MAAEVAIAVMVVVIAFAVVAGIVVKQKVAAEVKIGAVVALGVGAEEEAFFVRSLHIPFMGTGKQVMCV